MVAKQWVRKLSVLFSVTLLTLSLSGIVQSGPPADRATNENLQAVRKYIKDSWHRLTRSNARLADAAVDPKLHLPSDAKWPVYISRKEDIKQIEKTLASRMSAADFAKIDIKEEVRPLILKDNAVKLLGLG